MLGAAAWAGRRLAHLKQGRADAQWMGRTWWSLLNPLRLMDAQIKAFMLHCDRWIVVVWGSANLVCWKPSGKAPSSRRYLN